ncbi:MAG TPA: hypothetical protein VE081_11730, partial [Sporichthyaceae bacterium]|nr:hypothetical protein [Sporichthyaceae bacterium]
MSGADHARWAAEALFDVGATVDGLEGLAPPPSWASERERPTLTEGATEEERAARALLTRVAEPAEPRLGAAVERLGPGEVVRRLRGDGLEVPGAGAMRVRLVGLDGAAELEAA